MCSLWRRSSVRTCGESGVTSPVICKLLLAGLLAVSLSLKLIDGTVSEVSYHDLIGGRLASFLDRHGFVDREIVELADLAAATGRLDDCRLVLRSEEHTSELQSRQYLVCRLLLEKKTYI